MFLNPPMNFKNKIIGLKRGVVSDLKDPNGLNRVKVTLTDEKLELPYAFVMARVASNTFGEIIIPSIGDEVIVGFFGGKINDPVILGSVYNSKNKPSLQIEETNEIMLMQFPAGLKIEVNNKQDNQKITITTKKGHIITLDDGDNENIEVKEKSGKTSLKVDFKNGEIAFIAEKKISMTAGKDTVILEDQKGLNINSSAGKLSASVQEVALQAKANVNIEAKAKLTSKGGSGAEISSTGQTVVKGSMTQIN